MNTSKILVNACPACINNIGKFLRYINTPANVPVVFKPVCQFLACVMVKDIDIEFTLYGKPGKE
jgi:hypothetical protein